MNPYEMLNLAETAMIEQTDRSWLRYMLVIRGRKLHCISTRTQLPADTAVYEITVYHLNHGLDSKEWHELQTSMWRLREEFDP